MDIANWFHSVELQNGLTRGRKNVAVEADEIGLPIDLRGQTVLDIGCNDGGYSLLSVRRGASKVVATDVFVTDGLRHILANEPEGRAIEFICLDLMSDSFLALPRFDLVLFLGVLYHLRNPLAGLQRVRSVTGGIAMIESLYLDDNGECKAVFHEAEYDENFSNWWSPSISCLLSMIRVAGFAIENSRCYSTDRAIVQATPVNAREFDVNTLWTLRPSRIPWKG